MKSKLNCNDRPVYSTSASASERAAWNDALLTIITPGLKKLFSPENKMLEQAALSSNDSAENAPGQPAEDLEPEEGADTIMQLGRLQEPNDNDFSDSVSDAQDYVAARRSTRLFANWREQ